MKKSKYGLFDPTIPEVWDDKNQDGQWDHVEEITVMDSDFERKMQNTKVNYNFSMNFHKKLKSLLGMNITTSRDINHLILD